MGLVLIFHGQFELCAFPAARVQVSESIRADCAKHCKWFVASMTAMDRVWLGWMHLTKGGGGVGGVVVVALMT